MTIRPLGAASRVAKEMIDMHGAQNYKRIPFVAVTADGVWLYDAEGNRVMDLLGAYASVPIAHNWDVPIRALKEEFKRKGVGHCSQAIYTQQYAIFAQTLADMTGYDRVLPASDGRSSTEPVIDVCVMHALGACEIHGKLLNGAHPRVAVRKNYFHGRARTFSTNATFDPDQSAGKGDPVPGIVIFDTVEELECLFQDESVVAVLLEVHRGEGGPLFDQGEYVQIHDMARRYCKWIIVDDVQMGLFRCGHLMSWHAFGEEYRPDAVVLGKALGGGEIPVSALVGTEKFMKVLQPGTHGSTFGGYPRACVVATDTLRYFWRHEKRLAKRAHEIGERFVRNLSGIPGVRVEHRGAIIALAADGIPDGYLVSVDMACGEHETNVLAKWGHRHGDRVYFRLSPPMGITNKEIDLACLTIRSAMERRKEIVGTSC